MFLAAIVAGSIFSASGLYGIAGKSGVDAVKPAVFAGGGFAFLLEQFRKVALVAESGGLIGDEL